MQYSSQTYSVYQSVEGKILIISYSNNPEKFNADDLKSGLIDSHKIRNQRTSSIVLLKFIQSEYLHILAGKYIQILLMAWIHKIPLLAKE